MVRTKEFLSPSALSTWENNPDDFFYRYVCDVRTEKPPQTDPMSVGSAFDALIKNYLSRELFGEVATREAGFRIRDLVVKQCQEHTLPESLAIACECFEKYRECGALHDLLDQVMRSPVRPRMEFDVTRTIGDVPILGKPDLHFHTMLRAHVVTDFKVSGSCSRHGVSPQQGFQITRDCHLSASHRTAHKKYVPRAHPGGVEVSAIPMNETTDYFADQLCTYAWCLGEPVGSQDFICRIEQLACRPHATGLRIKCVTHQSTVAEDYQHKLLARYQACWDAVQRNHIWKDLTLEESQARGELKTRTLTVPARGQTNPDEVAGIDWTIA